MKNKTIFARKKTKRVLMLMGWYDHASHTGIAKYARDAGWILDNHSVHIGFHESPLFFDGVICYLYGQPALTALVRKIKKPIVDLQWQVKSFKVPRVLTDNHMAGRLAARHLMERGFKLFVYAAPDVFGNFASRERFEGYRDTLAAAGYRVKVLNGQAATKAHPSLSCYKCAKWLAAQLQLMPKPLAVFCTNDDFAVEILDACLIAGILVPEQIAVVGCDNDELTCTLAPVPLTSVDIDLSGIAYQGAKLLDQLMDGGKAPLEPMRFPAKGVVTRRSSDILAVEHIGVAKGLRFILDHHANPLIGVGDVAEASGMSRRGLGIIFHELVGRHVSEEIARVRVEKAMSMLVSGGQTVTQIAAACGYSGLKHLGRALKRETGLNARNYIKKHRRRHKKWKPDQ